MISGVVIWNSGFIPEELNSKCTNFMVEPSVAEISWWDGVERIGNEIRALREI